MMDLIDVINVIILSTWLTIFGAEISIAFNEYKKRQIIKAIFSLCRLTAVTVGVGTFVFLIDLL